MQSNPKPSEEAHLAGQADFDLRWRLQRPGGENPFLDAIYPWATWHGIFRHEHEWLRATHADLESMAFEVLLEEAAGCLKRRSIDPFSSGSWLEERASQIARHISRALTRTAAA